MEQKWTVAGVLGQWTMTVTLVPDPKLDARDVKRAFERFDSLDCHFYDIVNLAEALQLANR
jgi:hypothetical protein